MARVKKLNKYREFLEPLSSEELRILMSEVEIALQIVEKESDQEKQMQAAIMLRDGMKIGQEAYYMFKKGVVTCKVVMIAAEKIKIEHADGSQKFIEIIKFITKAKAKSLMNAQAPAEENAQADSANAEKSAG